MIETIVLNFLSGKLRVPVLAEVPEKPPGSFAVVEKTGGGRSTGLKQALSKRYRHWWRICRRSYRQLRMCGPPSTGWIWAARSLS